MHVDAVTLNAIVSRLCIAGCVAGEEEAAELVASASDAKALERNLVRREQGEPLAWITGQITFCGLTLHIDAGTYVPRPQSEDLARRAAALAGSGNAADLCTGSGAIASAIAALSPRASVVGVDNDRRAVTCARRNGVAAILGDLADPLASGLFDVVTAVAPYVPTDGLAFLPRDVVRYEPLSALCGGGDGLDVLRRVVVSAARILRPGGWLLVEAGASQDQLLEEVLDAAGFCRLETWRDEDGDLRGIQAQRSNR